MLSVVDAIADDLRRSVLTGEYAPGVALTEADVAARYEVARATAKASIEKLVAERVLVRSTHKTARVVQLGPEDVRDIYLSRAFLESEVLRRLAARALVPDAARVANEEIRRRWEASSYDIVDPDMDFHTALIDALDSERTSSIYRSLASEVKLCMSQVQGRQLLSPGIIAAEHELLLHHLAAGRPAAAAALLDEHLARARELLAEALGGIAGPEATRPSTALGQSQ